jgi:GNAT superfamily N-acetyltransferase
MTRVNVRPAVDADREFIIGVVPRLRAFGTPPLRPPEALDAAERRALEQALASPREDATLLVAELEDAGRAGVAFAQSAVDYFTRETHAHLDIIAVVESGEGRGVGRALIEAVERWAMGRGYRFMDLNVFAGNARARAVYERCGYAPDVLRYYKELGTDGS